LFFETISGVESIPVFISGGVSPPILRALDIILFIHICWPDSFSFFSLEDELRRPGSQASPPPPSSFQRLTFLVFTDLVILWEAPPCRLEVRRLAAYCHFNRYFFIFGLFLRPRQGHGVILPPRFCTPMGVPL